MSIALPKGSPIWESHLGEPFAVQSCTVASHFHTSIVMTEASSWNWFGVNNGGIHANGFSCDRIMCYIIDQRDRHFKNNGWGTPLPMIPFSLSSFFKLNPTLNPIFILNN